MPSAILAVGIANFEEALDFLGVAGVRNFGGRTFGVACLVFDAESEVWVWVSVSTVKSSDGVYTLGDDAAGVGSDADG
jgi:hypothetical protein